jgi:hypothetical protein
MLICGNQKNGKFCKILKTRFYNKQSHHIIKEGKRIFKVSDKEFKKNFLPLVQTN